MKDYLKPEVEFVDFASEEVMDDHMGGDTTSTDEYNPYG